MLPQKLIFVSSEEVHAEEVDFEGKLNSKCEHKMSLAILKNKLFSVSPNEISGIYFF